MPARADIYDLSLAVANRLPHRRGARAAAYEGS